MGVAIAPTTATPPYRRWNPPRRCSARSSKREGGLKSGDTTSRRSTAQPPQKPLEQVPPSFGLPTTLPARPQATLRPTSGAPKHRRRPRSWHPRDMPIVALTGGIASGKSTIAERLAGHGAVIVDADQLVREVQLPGSPVLAAIAAAFGERMLRPD